MSKKHPSTSAPIAPAQQKRKLGPVRGDDRNLIEIDEAFKEAEFEDKVWLFWERYKTLIITGIIAAIVATIAVQGVRVYRDSRLATVQADFMAATTNEERIAFAKANSGHTLAGIALLEAADNRFADEAFSEAAPLYADAAKSLAQAPELRARALLGHGVALARSGDRTQAVTILNGLFRDTTAADALRAEAAYHSAVITLEDGQPEQARETLQSILPLRNAGIWRNQAERMLRRIQ